MAQVVLDHLTKTFGGTPAVDDVTLTVESGESVVLLGPSGCGKTTTLRMIAGFESPTAGRILIDGAVIADDRGATPPEERQIGMVFQSYALWPHLSVADNIRFGLTTRGGRRRLGLDRASQHAAVERTLGQVQLDGYGDRFPHELSGGQQQRVALARALVTNPRVLLLDEPLSNLDTRLREDMRGEIRRLQQESGITMIYITHDRSEALGLADRIVSLKAGRVQQVGPPEQLYQQPVSRFVAESLGPANVVAATVHGASAEGLDVTLATGQRTRVTAPDLTVPAPGSVVQVCVRPHDLLLRADAEAGTAAVRSRAFLGDETHYLLDVDGVSEPLRVFDRTLTAYPPGTRVAVEAAAHKTSVLTQDDSSPALPQSA